MDVKAVIFARRAVKRLGIAPMSSMFWFGEKSRRRFDDFRPEVHDSALIRLKPFSEFCELPDLPGREPFGGRILSHDFVEAALMVAEGWEVWLAWDIEGTYEEAPPTLVDHLIRDRRWCQGNLQHLWLIFARKLPFSVRMHLFMGIMAAHTLMVLGIFLGRAVGWNTQNRETDGTPWAYAIRFHAFPTLLGAAWAALAYNISPVFAAWMPPILLGLLLSAPVSVWTSRSRYSKVLARHKILSTPEELNPPTVIRMADEAGAAIDPALDASAPARRGIIAAVVDPYVNGVHVSLLEHSELSHVEEALAERCLALGPSGLSKNELTELLYLAPAMLMMHRAVWLRSVEGIHSVWTQAVESYRRRLEHSPLPETN